MTTPPGTWMSGWNYPTSIRFGVGRIQELPDACRTLGIKKPLLVTDQGLASLSIVAEAVGINKSAGLETGVFSDVLGNPTGTQVMAGVEVFRKGQYDGVIAFGGGSALDVGKAVGLMAGQSRSLWDFEDQADWWTRVNEEGMVPVVAVPTTSGTGSEVGRASVIVDTDRSQKVIIFHPKMLPEQVICDPALTVGLPSQITAAVGMDALSHNLEAYCSPFAHPMADGIAIEGMRLVHRWLIEAYKDGHNLDARSGMMAASTMGATAFQKGLGAMHAVAHPVGALFHTHHGLTNAVAMPYVLRFNREVIDQRLCRAASFLGLTHGSFEGFLSWILALRDQLGIPHSLSALGVPLDAAEQLSVLAAEDPSASTNPRVLTPDNLLPLIRAMIEGNLEGIS